MPGDPWAVRKRAYRCSKDGLHKKEPTFLEYMSEIYINTDCCSTEELVAENMYQQILHCTHTTEDVLFRVMVDNALRQSRGLATSVLNSPQNQSDDAQQQYRYRKKRHEKKRQLTVGDHFLGTDLCKRLLKSTVGHVVKRRDREHPRRRGLIRKVFRLVDYLGQHKDVYDVLKSVVSSFGTEGPELMGRRSRSDPPAFES